MAPQESSKNVRQATIPLDSINWKGRFREDFGDIESLSESIKEKGLIQPITVSLSNPSGQVLPKGTYWLLAGERRITAAKAAGLDKLPAIIRDGAGETDAREIELIENLFRKDPTWQEQDALVQEIDRLYREKNLDWSVRKTAQLLDRGLGSVARSLQRARAVEVIPELGNYKTADEAFKVLKKLEENTIVEELRSRQKTSLSNGGLDKGIAAMLRLADHNYVTGDTFKGLAELRSNGAVHIIECDPPYGIDLTKVKASKDSVASNIHSYNEVAAEEYPVFLSRLAKELYRVAAQNSWLIFWFGPSWQHEVLLALRQAGWEVDEIPAIWVKEHGQTLQPEIYLARTYEPFYLCRKGRPVLLKRGRANTFIYPGVPSNVKYHPTQRPVELIQELLEMLSTPGSIVLCPFLGSGATIRAAYNAGMKVFGWDISGEYKDKLMLLVENDARQLTVEEDMAEED